MAADTQALGGAQARRAISLIVAVTIGGAAFYLALGIWAGWQQLSVAFAQLGVAMLAGPPIALVSYLLRFARWDYILKRTSARIPAAVNLRIYLAGLALTATPAKAGETVRSVLLVPWGVPVGMSLAAFFVDRLSDLIGVLALAAITGGGGAHWWWLGAAGLAAGFALRWIFVNGHAERWAATLGRRRLLGWLRALLSSGMHGYLNMWRGAPVLAYAAVGTCAYGLQGLVFAAYVRLLWPSADIVHAVHIFAVSSLAGAASMIPGGLGATEITMIAMLGADGMPWADATAAAVGSRLVSLWFSIVLGLCCLVSLRRASLRALDHG